MAGLFYVHVISSGDCLDCLDSILGVNLGFLRFQLSSV